MKNRKEAKGVWIRKTYGQRVTLRPEDTASLSLVNTTLVKLWNLAINQINTWLSMPSSVSIEQKWRAKLGFDIQIKNPDKPSITPISLNFWLTSIRKDEEFGNMSVTLQREMLRRLAGGFASYFALLKKNDTRARPPSPRELGKAFIALTWTEKSFSIDHDHLVASVGSGIKVKIPLGSYIQEVLKSLPEGSKVAQVTVSKRDNEYWANFVCNIPQPEPIKTQKIIAVDLGAGDIVFSCSDGLEFSFPARRPDKKWRREIQSVENRIIKCKKGSRAWKRRSYARQVMHRKSLNQHTDHQRKLADWLTKQKAVIVVGKMKTRLGLSQSDGTADQHWGVQNTGYAFRLLMFITEKVVERGLTLLEFPDPAREGSLEDPLAKFNAARKLLDLGCKNIGIPLPSVFKRINLSFPQGG